jgi:hypothetical protein
MKHLTLQVEYKLQAHEKEVFKKIYVPKKGG